MGAMPFAARISDILESIIRKLARDDSYEIKAKDRDSVRKQLKKMFGSTNTDTLYKAFYAWLEEPAMFKFARLGVYESTGLPCSDSRLRGHLSAPVGVRFDRAAQHFQALTMVSWDARECFKMFCGVTPYPPVDLRSAARLGVRLVATWILHTNPRA
jgi:hypothetical protein